MKNIFAAAVVASTTCHDADNSRGCRLFYYGSNHYSNHYSNHSSNISTRAHNKPS